MKSRMDKDILIDAPDESQGDFGPAGGIERIVAEIDEDASRFGKVLLSKKKRLLRSAKRPSTK